MIGDRVNREESPDQKQTGNATVAAFGCLRSRNEILAVRKNYGPEGTSRTKRIPYERKREGWIEDT